MRKRERRAGGRLAASLALLSALLATSCVSYDAGRVNNYVGPAAGDPPDGARWGSSPAAQAGPGPAAQTGPSLGGPTTMPGAALPSLASAGAIRLNVQSAIVLALANNRSLLVDRYNPPRRRTFEETELAAFDPVLFGSLSGGRTREPAGGVVRSPVGNADAVGGQVGLAEFLPTGTSIRATASGSFTNDPANAEQDISRLGLTATQSLLRGYGLAVNLASLHQARLDTLSSEYELRGLALAVIAQTEEAYWDYVLALRQVEIVAQSLQLAEKQLAEIDQRIDVGRLGKTERAAPEAEVALRREDLIDANSAAAKSRLALLRLLSPPGAGGLDREVLVEQQPVVTDIPLEGVAEHLALADRLRPELNQARLLVDRNELELVKTRNGLLPRLDLFVTLGKSGYADSFGRAVGDVFTRDTYDALVGVSGEVPLGNRGPRAENERARLTRDQSKDALANLAQLVELDVRTAYLEVARSRDQLAATAATRKLQEEKLRSETGKFDAGRSTTLQVAQVLRDLEASQISEVRAVADYLKAFVELYRLEGSLLDRRGIVAPGKEPVARK